MDVLGKPATLFIHGEDHGALGALCADAVAPNLQEALLRKHRQSKPTLILHTNWLSALLTLMYMVPTGEAYNAVKYLQSRRRVAGLLLLQSFAGYCGVLAYIGAPARPPQRPRRR